jgi:hypothetical protein
MKKNFGCMELYFFKRLGWIRLFNIVFFFKDVSIHGLTFSERNGFKKRIQIANWSISFEKSKR